MSLDYRAAGLEVRERFHLGDEALPRVLEALAARGAEEAVIVRTCNRLEAYCRWDAGRADRQLQLHGGGRLDAIGDEICRAWVGGDHEAARAMRRVARVATGAQSVRHLLRVASGLESQVLGDIHIIGQLRQAFQSAIGLGTVGSQLHRLFETALRVGKRVKRETHLMATRSGVGSEAARIAVLRAREGNAGRFVVVGSGKIGAQAARSLARRGARDLTIVNRTVHRAERLALELAGARGAGLDRLPDALARASAIIVATDAMSPVVTREMVEEACRARALAADGAPPVLVIDVSVPRNVAPDVAALAGVELMDLDRLHPEAAEIEGLRRAAVPRAEALVAEAEEELMRWLDLGEARDALRPLHGVLSEICRREIAYVAGASEHAERAAARIVARLLAHPMVALRSASERGEPIGDLGDVLGTLFASAVEESGWESSRGPDRRAGRPRPSRSAPMSL